MTVQFPTGFLHSLQGLAGFTPEAFQQSHTKAGAVSIRLNPNKPVSIEQIFPSIAKEQVPWCKQGYYLEQRPSFTFDPIFHAGAYYVQEASSMFLEHIIETCIPSQHEPLRVLDLCAAPGGKTTLLQSILPHNSLLVANETIRSRVAPLRDNVIKWGAHNIIITSSDAKELARLENFFDLIIVDAPCSGSGLFRKYEDAVDEWSTANVELCRGRQQRILADVWPALRQGGTLIYSTCSFSKEEDEDNLDFLSTSFSVNTVHIPLKPEWNITEVQSVGGNYGYRFWPHKLQGEGFFIGAVTKESGGFFADRQIKEKSKKVPKKGLAELLEPWIDTTDMVKLEDNGIIKLAPQQVVTHLPIIKKNAHISYYGIDVGEDIHGKLIPSHALAMSPYVKKTVPVLSVDVDEAINFLQKKSMLHGGNQKGWHLVTCTLPLGWVNVLPGRINNYYPKEMRILKDKP